MIARISRKSLGIVDYLLSGKKADSNYTRDQKDNTVCLYGNIDTLDKSIKYLYENKNYKDNYLHISISFSKNDIEKLNNMDEVQREAVLKDITESYIKHHTSGYDLQNEVIAYAEAHKPKIKINEEGNERLEHIHIVISKQNALSNTQLKTTFASTYIDETLQTYINKKYNFDEPKKHKRTEQTLDAESKQEEHLRKYYKTELAHIKKEEDLINYFETRKIKYKKVKTKRNEYYKIFVKNIKNKEVAINLRGKDFKNLEFIARNQEYTLPDELSELNNILEVFYNKRKIEIAKRRSKSATKQLEELTNSRVKKYNNLFYIKGYKTEKSNKNMTYTNYKQNIQITDDTEKNELHVNYSTCENKQEAVKTMLDIAIAKGWKLENLEVFGSDEFKKEAYKQIKERLERQNKKQKLELKTIERAVTPVQQNIKEIQDIKTTQIHSKEYLAEIKEKINLNEVLKYAQEHYKINIKDYELTKDNKINNITNKQKPKNAIDFFNKEVGLTLNDSINILDDIYKKQKNINNDISNNISKNINKNISHLPKNGIINYLNKKGEKMKFSITDNNVKDQYRASNWYQTEISTKEDLLKLVTSKPYTVANYKTGHRNRDNVESFNSFLVYDIDNDKDEPQLTIEEAESKLRDKNINALIIPTKSHKKEKNNHIAERFRILIPLQSPISTTDIEVYRKTQELIAKDLKLYDYVDKRALRDKARYYEPSPFSAIHDHVFISKQQNLDITKFENQARIDINENHKKINDIQNNAVNINKNLTQKYANNNMNYLTLVDYNAINEIDITKLMQSFEKNKIEDIYSDSENYLYYIIDDTKYNIIKKQDNNTGKDITLAYVFETNEAFNSLAYLNKVCETNKLTDINKALMMHGFGDYSCINTELIEKITDKNINKINSLAALRNCICEQQKITNLSNVTLIEKDNKIHIEVFGKKETLNEQLTKKIKSTINANNERLNKERAKKEAEELAKQQQQQQVVSHTITKDKGKSKSKRQEWD